MDNKTEIKICMGSSCFARGNNENLEIIENFIKENNKDATIDLVGLRCENKCSKGPNIFINGVEYNEITTDKLNELLKEL